MKKTKLILNILLCITAISFIACSSPSGSDNSGNTDTTGTSGVDTGTSGTDTGTSGTDTGTSGTDTGTSGTGTGTSGTGTGTSGTSGTGTGGTEGTGGSGDTGSGTGGGNENPPVTYIGTKAPTEAKAVGDIVFTDGSAMPYSEYAALSEDDVKTAKKNAAIALIFYKGTGLNSDVNGVADNTTSRTLGVGLKHNKTYLAWCIPSANAYYKQITTILCPLEGEDSALTFTGDKNGSDNLEQIEAFDGISDTGTGGSTTSAEQAALNYPAFYFGKNYKDHFSRVAGTVYQNGWYLPSIAELFQIYACREDSVNGFNIDEASESLGGDKFGTWKYMSSSQNNYDQCSKYALFFGYGGWGRPSKGNTDSEFCCCIREFN
ncbi:hypothetical protein [Treponema bryantii]|uniref:hypothetical protein n=1 Tax=Treponema bryantii TaxID=163 RepID=UPI0003B33CE2|nr:hypothetical protein [Treponema bryantii]